MIEVSNLTFSYAGREKPAVKGIGFSVEEASIFGFLGPSGAGKSTAQKIMIGLLKNYQGKVSVFGRDLKAWGRDYYERVGVSLLRVLAEPGFLPSSHPEVPAAA